MPEIQLGGQPLISQTGTDPPQWAVPIGIPAGVALPAIVLAPTDTAPTATEGTIYYDSTSDVLKVHDGTSWNNIISGDQGYLTSETDPVFSAHDASNVTSSKITNWDTAHGWGDHSTVGYGSAGIPAGMIAPFATTIPLTGWLVCNGASTPTSAYGELFNAIGTTWGGDSINFNLPDLRGWFLRGHDGGAGTDPDADDRVGDDNVGSTQQYMVHSHVHWLDSWHSEDIQSYAKIRNRGYGQASQQASAIASTNISDNISSSGTVGSQTYSGGSETRPKNKAVLYCIKYTQTY